MEYRDVIREVIQGMVSDVEIKINRPMTDAEKKGLEEHSLMMLESISMGFYLAKSDEEITAWLLDITKIGENSDGKTSG